MGDCSLPECILPAESLTEPGPEPNENIRLLEPLDRQNLIELLELHAVGEAVNWPDGLDANSAKLAIQWR